jgi:seryl-tRNA synthetase
MIDVKTLRETPEILAAALARRGSRLSVDELAALDRSRREVRHQAEEIRAEQKQAGKAIASLQGDEKQAAIARAGNLSDDFKRLTAEADELDVSFEALWIQVPNIAHESAPDGEALDIIDVARGVKTSGSRFAYLKGQAVLLEFGLVRFAMDRLMEGGFTPVIPPVLVREEALYGTGFFPDDSEQVYAVEKDELYLVGTSEVSLAALHLDEILDEADLPVRYAGFSTCFRREAGTYGKDTRGIFRVHQFDKVEMFSFCHPDKSWDEHENLLAMEEGIVQALGLPYRVVNVAAGDLGASAAKKYDIEAWIPSQEAFREITSCSNTTDYQARRLKARFKSEKGNRLVYTLNGTAVAVGRTLLAIMENFQQADGTILVPEALRPYVGFDVIGA